MAFGINIGNLFSRKKTLQTIKADELRKEEIGLQNEERRIEKDINRSLADEQQIKSEYAVANSQNDAHKKKMLARKLQEVRSKTNAFDKRHDTLIKQKRMISGLILIKENTEFLDRITGGSKINSMDMVEIQAFVEQATLDGELTNDKLENLVKAMDDSAGSYGQNESDTDLTDLMTELDAEMDTSTTDEATYLASNSEIDQAMQALDKELSSQKKSERSNS
ncbi:MAG: hypothetical protein KAG45_07125 [Methyloprofundus sp.]|nr:hypothetical protein [Methyloprofundus sp.]